jgi:hypothetical protein
MDPVPPRDAAYGDPDAQLVAARRSPSGDDAAGSLALPSASGRSSTTLSTRVRHGGHLGSARSFGSAPASRGVLEPQGPFLDIVGSGSEDKRALLVSPFLWEFGEWEPNAAIAELLASTRGYEGGVSWVRNTDSTSTDVGLSTFTGWGAYDVVHVASHGLRVCDERGCRGVLMVNTLKAFFPSGLSEAEQIEKLRELNQTGVELVPSKNGRYVGINADFFRSYASDVVDTVIFLTSCQLFGSGATDLVEALTGTSNIVFGWTEAVYSTDAYRTVTRLFEDLTEGGYPTEIAHQRLGDLRTGRATPHGPSPLLRRAPRPSGGDLHVREVVTLLHPGSGQELTAADRVQIEGIQGDGEDDAAPFLVRVDGVVPEHADDMTLHVSVDGVAADAVAVGSGTPNEQDQWFVEGEIPLGYDLAEDRTVDFLATVELVSEGESEHRSEAILTGASWTLASEGETTGEVTLHGQTAQGGWSWTAQADFAVDEEGRVFGDGMGFLSGTELLLSYDDEELFCLLAAPVEMGYVFDLTGQVTDGVLRLQAENVEAAEFTATTCGGVTEAAIEASLLGVVTATLETEVPFQHEEVQEREIPGSGPLSHDGVVVGSYETLYRWVNTVRKEGCPVGGGDDEC